jgi:hypothetical protein
VADIDKITRRPNEYLFETGVPQLVGGLIVFFFGSSVLIQQVLPKGFIAQELPGWIAICCAGAALLGARALKRRIVFPRGGYVEPRPHPAVRFVVVACVAVLVAVVILPMAWLRRLPHTESRLVEPGLAIFLAILYLASVWQKKSTSKMKGFKKSTSMMGFGVYLAAIAPLLWWLPVGNYERGAWLQVAIGAPLAVAGAIRLRSFLKANPRPVETTNE